MFLFLLFFPLLLLSLISVNVALMILRSLHRRFMIQALSRPTPQAIVTNHFRTASAFRPAGLQADTSSSTTSAQVEVPERFQVRSVTKALERTQMHRAAELAQMSRLSFSDLSNWRNTPSPLARFFSKEATAGCLTHHATAWQHLCLEMCDVFPATVVTFGLLTMPLARVPKPKDVFEFARAQINPAHQEWLDAMIVEWEAEGVIAQVAPSDVHHVSPIFVVDKKHDADAPLSKHYRFILDLRALNPRFGWERGAFQMEDLRTLKAMLPASELRFGALIDCDQGYWQVPLSPELSKLMSFATSDRRLFSFRTLPFGLSIAPWVFCRIFRPVLKKLRAAGIDCIMYIDDLLILGPSWEQASANVQTALRLFQELGVRVSPKSKVEPQEIVRFLGIDVDIPRRTFTTPAEREQTLRQWCKTLATKANAHTLLPIVAIARLLGLLQACRWGTRAVPFLAAPLQTWVRHNFDPQTDPKLRSSVVTDPTLADALMHIRRYLPRLRCVPLHVSEDCVVELVTDASEDGFGASVTRNALMVMGEQWSESTLAFGDSLVPPNKRHSINALELRAVELALRHFAWFLQRKTVRIVTDNATAQAYLNRVYGEEDHLSQIALSVWELALQLDIQLLPAEWIDTKSNFVADDMSRAMQHTEWSTTPSALLRIQQYFGISLSYDRFASQDNHVLEPYDSLREGRDAFRAGRLSWTTHKNYVCCPFALLPRVLGLLEDYQAHAVVIAPLWKSAPFFPRLQRLSHGRHLLLHPAADFTPDPQFGHAEPSKAIAHGWEVAAFLISPL